MNHVKKLIAIPLLTLTLTGCETIGKGISEFGKMSQTALESVTTNYYIWCSPENFVARKLAIAEAKRQDPDYIPICESDRGVHNGF